MKRAFCLGAMCLWILGVAVGCATSDRRSKEVRVHSEMPPDRTLAEAWDNEAGWTMGSSAAESF